MTDNPLNPSGRSQYMAPHLLKTISNAHVNGRKRMFEQFMKVIQPGPETKVVDLGVTYDDVTPGSNYFEKLYPYKDHLTCAGTEDASHLEVKYPGTRFVQIEPGKPLPFSNNEFDVLFSSAVIEHVGSRNNQQEFVNEILRTTQYFFFTTPNRWFPIEIHTNIPFLHYLPPPVFRKIIAKLGFEFYSKEENLNLLGTRDVKALFPDTAEVHVGYYRIFGFASNLLVYGKSKK